MASIRHDRRIAAPADVVWGVVSNPYSVTEWFPGIVSCRIEGPTRYITTASGIEMPEEIVINDARQRRFGYRITAPIYKWHLGTIDVLEISDSESFCIYSTSAEPDTLALLVGGATIGALDEIQRIAQDRAKELL